MAIAVKELNHVAIHVSNLDESIHFYRDILELPVLDRPAFDFGGAWFAFGTQELHLIEDKALASSARRHHHFALLVDDTTAVEEHLKVKGWTAIVSHGSRPDGAPQLFITDPDGYSIEFTSLPWRK